MSYQLEREMEFRVSRYRSEAAVRRAIPRGRGLRRLAATLRRLADRIEERAANGSFAGEARTVVIQGRNQ